ncbi:MAG: hypothetical protein AAFZ18_19485 [Myxococcota bacterium]
MSRPNPIPVPLLALALAACGDDGGSTVVDAGPADMGMVAPPDSGVVATCPIAENNPSCQQSMDCLAVGEDFSQAPNCEGFCPGFSAKMCLTGQCQTPATIEANEPITLNVDVGGLVNDISFLARMAIDAETAGGASIGCAEVMANPKGFFQEPCFNITDVRTTGTSGFSGTVFPLPFSRIQADRKVIFVVYGFADDDTMVDPLGISCTEVDVPPAGSQGMTQQVGANNMTRIL